jgi:hypothetical protein
MASRQHMLVPFVARRRRSRDDYPPIRRSPSTTSGTPIKAPSRPVAKSVTPLRRRALCQAEPRSPAPTRQGPGSRDEQFAASLSRRMEPSRPGVDGAMRRESDRRWWIPGGGSEGERLRAAPFKPRSHALPIAPSRRRSTMRTAFKHLAAALFPPRIRPQHRRPVSRDTTRYHPIRNAKRRVMTCRTRGDALEPAVREELVFAGRALAASAAAQIAALLALAPSPEVRG